MKYNFLFLHLFLTAFLMNAIKCQPFYFGADQSYVNEMEDCGADFKENGISKDVHQIFADHGCNLVRLRLWHTPSWHDALNEGKRYSDLGDVKRSIRRIKSEGMKVLLDFHLSDNWADPSKQIVPTAWTNVVDDLETLQDSLYNYIHSTLTTLESEGLLPEMVQIGNETNRGILLSEEQNKEWTLEWNRNATLFNAAIRAVREVSKNIDIALHVAGPAEVEWWISEFVKNGVTDFDIIGLSYYWAWHKPTSIAETGEVISRLKSSYPDKKVIIVETGYLWTKQSQDQANNIINDDHPDYQPTSPENQKEWLVDLTQTVIDKNGDGVIYWEPSWVSTNCNTQWGRGSHQEHATFFDFDHNLLLTGGIQWMEHNYGLTTSVENQYPNYIQIMALPNQSKVRIDLKSKFLSAQLNYMISDTLGRSIQSGILEHAITELDFNDNTSNVYIIMISSEKERLISKQFSWIK